ncbi:MAG TPA: PAS domain S-box protein, partial [Clostridia bacterium]|nr:PAS domain S-box protein [Clostridia bacterium]
MSGVEHYVDRVDTEKARLQEEVLSYEAVLDHVPEAIAVCVDSRIAYVNSAAITLLQAQSASHLSGREFVDFIHQDFRPLIARRQVETQGADSQPHFKFIRLQLQSSSIVEAQWAGIPIHYHGRGAVLNIFRDISEERKQAEALRAIVNATAGSGVDFFEGLVSQLATVLGMSYALVAKLLPGNSPRARTLALWARGKLLQNVEYDLASSPCEQLIGKDLCHFPSGVQAHFPKDDLLARMGAESYYGVPLLGSNHKPLGVLCVLNEQPMPDTELAGSLMRVFASRAVSEMEHLETIEALKASEATYRRLHESMIDAFVAADLDGRITDHNESFRRMLGYDPSEILRLTLCDIIAGTWKDYQDGVIQQQVLKRGYSDIIEEDFRRKDGNVLPVELRIVLLRDAAGVPSGSWAIVRDIAKRKATQEALRRQLAFTELVTGVLAQFATCTEAEIDDHIQVSLRDIAQFFGVDYAFIALAAEDFSHWSATHGWASSELPDRLALYQNVPMGSFAWIEKTLLAGQIV